jgi:large subunit ribosomal protein L22
MPERKKDAYVAHARYIHYSPYKLRPIADVIRGKNVVYALNWLATCATKRVSPLKKALESAVANAKHLNEVSVQRLMVQEIRVDQGPMFRYFKPGAMGRANVYRRRFSHISVVLAPIRNI